MLFYDAINKKSNFRKWQIPKFEIIFIAWTKKSIRTVRRLKKESELRSEMFLFLHIFERIYLFHYYLSSNAPKQLICTPHKMWYSDFEVFDFRKCKERAVNLRIWKWRIEIVELKMIVHEQKLFRNNEFQKWNICSEKIDIFLTPVLTVFM